MRAKYITSMIDGIQYCKTNGQFTRHLVANDLTYKDYYEMYISGITPLCSCGNPLVFYQNSESYAGSCGSPTCVGRTIRKTRQAWTDQQRLRDSENKKIAAAKRTKEEIKESSRKTQQTCLTRYGVNWPAQSDIQKNKSKQTKKQRYGDEYYAGWQKSATKNRNKTVDEQNAINSKRRQTNIARFGVSCPLQLPGVLNRSAISNSIGREFALPSGKTIRVRGYEHLVISSLVAILPESDIIVHDLCSSYKLPVFEYVDHRRHNIKYYPDIFIPSQNKIIEVKGQWWWDGNGDSRYSHRLANNYKKAQSVLRSGYIYEVWLFTTKDKYRIINDFDL